MALRAAVAFALLAGATPPRSLLVDAVAQSASPKLVDLKDVSDLRARFNADSAFTRIVLLVSPT